MDLSAPLPGYPGGFTALHLAIELEDMTSLHIVDFLLGNGSVRLREPSCPTGQLPSAFLSLPSPYFSRTENCTDVEGNTPLHLAVTNDHSHCVKLLLLHGSDITISESSLPLSLTRLHSLYMYISAENSAGLTPVDIARENSHDECMELVRLVVHTSWGGLGSVRVFRCLPCTAARGRAQEVLQV